MIRKRYVALWLVTVPFALLAAALSWLLTPYAVRRAVAVMPPDEPDLTATTWARLRSHPLMLPRRLPPWARWLMELGDDQLLPPGRYEPSMRPYMGDWEAQSIAMLRRNPANAFDRLVGLRVYVGAPQREHGPRADDVTYGVWTGVADDRAWQVMGLIRLPGPRDLQFNLGYTVRDLFDGTPERPVHTARFRLPVLRLPLRGAL